MFCSLGLGQWKTILSLLAAKEKIRDEIMCFSFFTLWKTCQKGREEVGEHGPLERKPKNRTPCKMNIFGMRSRAWCWNEPMFFQTRRRN